jgi:HEPN domain-containing protein
MKEAAREAIRWFLQAEDDLRFVEWVAAEGVFFDKGCFMAQQAGEKALKACLYATGKRRVIGHSLFEMCRELAALDSRFEPIISSAKRLDRFYISARYPNGIPGGSPFQTFDSDDLKKALEDLQAIRATSRSYLESMGIWPITET